MKSAKPIREWREVTIRLGVGVYEEDDWSGILERIMDALLATNIVLVGSVTFDEAR